MSDSSSPGDTARIDTTPNVPRPPESEINAAMRGVARTMRDVKPLSDGKKVLRASTLVARLREMENTRDAAFWAVHLMVEQGMLRTQQIRTFLPFSFGGLDFATGGRATSQRTCSEGDALLGIPRKESTPLDDYYEAFEVVATESLWEWRPENGALPRDDEDSDRGRIGFCPS